MPIVCNPLNIPYRYQFAKRAMGGQEEPSFHIFREAADPSLIEFKGLYYLFPSMTGGFYTSQNLCEWQFHKFLSEMPVCDYAPDVRKIGEHLYFCASRRSRNCDFYRTKDPLTEPFERIEGSFSFWDPDMFLDDDGRLYFYWGCTNTEPIWGVELDRETMKPLTEPVPMFDSNTEHRGYERNGQNHVPPKSQAEIDAMVSRMMMLAQVQCDLARKMLHVQPGQDLETHLRRMFGNRPYIEGPWMTKHEGKYYLQYAIPGTQYNIYGDGVYVANSPLGPYTPAKNNPYSYVPGGFMTGAGHGSTLKDKHGRYWHTATTVISKNHDFERRLGLWKAGFDADGELYCDQNYADWPMDPDAPAFTAPKWMLLSYGKPVTVSSGVNAQSVTNENIQSWWAAADNTPQWVQVDLEKCMDVRAVQINFADWEISAPIPENQTPNRTESEIRYLDMRPHCTRWLLEGSLDGENYFTIEDKRNAATDLPHDFILREEGLQARYVRLTITELPYGQIPKISGFRIFGKEEGEAPRQVTGVTWENLSELDVKLTWDKGDATGCNVLFGHAPDKLYHSYLTYESEVTIGAFVTGQEKYVRIDAFNGAGITKGEIYKV